MSILDYFKHKNNDKIRKNTMVYGVYKEVLYEGEISAMDYLMLSPFNRKQYVFPCLFAFTYFLRSKFFTIEAIVVYGGAGGGYFPTISFTIQFPNSQTYNITSSSCKVNFSI